MTPAGYDVAKAVSTRRSDARVTVGFDAVKKHVPRFLARLRYLVPSSPPEREVIARFDHNESSPFGHDVYAEGLHRDVYRRKGGSVKIYPRHAPLPQNRGIVVGNCVDYFDAEAEYFIDVFEGNVAPGGPPPWP